MADCGLPIRKAGKPVSGRTGQPETLQLPGGRTHPFEYDEAGRIVVETDPLGRVTRTGYDGNSLRVSRLTLPDGAQWLAEYDHLGRLLRSTDPLGRGESYEYPEGPAPWPHSHIDARGGRQRMAWDSRGLLIAYTDCSGKITRHDYDADGQLLATTDALGHVTRFERQRTCCVPRSRRIFSRFSVVRFRRGRADFSTLAS